MANDDDRNPDAPATEVDRKVDEAQIDEVQILEVEDDLDTGMHRVNVCFTNLGC